MTGMLVQLGQQTLRDVLSWVIAVLAFAILLRFQWNLVWLLLAGALIGMLRFWLLKG
jgi:chromate transport protein ChrA